MVNHKEILRLKSLGLTHREITDATGCGRNTVTRTLARARVRTPGQNYTMTVGSPTP